MKKLIIPEDICQEIYALYQNGLSRNELIKKYNISSSVIVRIFREHNWQFRNKSCGKYLVNEEYFDNIDSFDKAYIIGLLLADGCNHEKQNEISLELQEQDGDIVKEINNILNRNRPIYYYNYVGKYNHRQGTYRMICNNKHISERLHEIGMIANKSLILDFPNSIPKELIPSMLHGYVDGDGWISKKTIGFMSSDKFCYKAQDYISNELGITCKVIDMKKHYKDSTKTLYIANYEDKKNFANIVFIDGNLKIQRKYDKCIEYGYL